MSEIKFSADFDNSKLEAGVKQSNKTIAEFVKETEKAGVQIDNTFIRAGKTTETVAGNINKYGKAVVTTIEEQKKLIKSIEDDVKSLQKTFDKMAPGKAKVGLGSELSSAKRALKEEYAELTKMQEKFLDDQRKIRFNDTHTKALVENAKRDKAEFNKIHQQALKDNAEYDKSHKSLIQNIVGGIGKWAAGLFTLGAALKIAKGIINSTEGSMHKFEVVMAEASAGVGYFFKTIASGDWSNFFGNLSRAISGAAEFVDTMERLANKQNEQKIKSSQLDKEIAELRDETYDKDEANNVARQDALTKIIAKQEEKYNAEAKLAKELYDTNLKKAATDSGLAEDQIKRFVSEYSSLEELIKKGERYNEIQKALLIPNVSNEFYQRLKEQEKALGETGAEAGKYVTQISKVTPEVRKQISEFAAAANEAEAAFGSKNRRDKMQLAEVTNKIKKDAEDAKKRAEEEARLVNQLKKQYELLDKAVEDGNTAEMKKIAEKILLLEKELSIRIKIAKAAITSAYGGVITKIDVSSLGKSGLPSFTAPVQESGLMGSPEQARIRQAQAKELGRQRQWNINDAENDERKIRDQKEILRGATNLTYQLGQQLGLSEDQLVTLGAELDAFTQLASGNYIGAAVTLLSQLMSSFPSQTEKFADEIDRLNYLLEKQQRIVDQSLRFGGTENAIRDQIKILQQQAEATIKTANIMAGKGRGREAADLINQWEDIKASIEDANLALSDFMTGGLTENTITDAIAQQFQEAETSVTDFADFTNQVLIDAVMNIFKSNILDSPLMKTYMDEAKKALSDNILSDSEKENLVRLGKEFSDSMKPTWEGLTSTLDMGNGPQPGLTGAISRQITEETGSELAGLFRRFADDERAVKDYTIMGVNHLVGIEANTMNTVLELQKANIKLDTVISNTKQVPSGSL